VSDPTLHEVPYDPIAAEDPARVFGPLVGGHNVEDAVLLVLTTWMATYCAEICRLIGRPPATLPSIRSWRVSSEMESFPEDQHPAVIVRSPGLLDVPEQGGGITGHAFMARWDVLVGVQAVTRGDKRRGSPRARRLAQMYATAARGAIIQQRDPHGLMGMTDWIGVDQDELDSSSDRTTALIIDRYSVQVNNNVEWGRGPIDPLDPGPDDGDPDPPLWPDVVLAAIDLEKNPTDGSLDVPGDRVPPHT
jgi:hypothetical protein